MFSNWKRGYAPEKFHPPSKQWKTEFAPAYDLLNTIFALKYPEKEITLPIGGKKQNLTQKILADYFVPETQGLLHNIISKTLHTIKKAVFLWYALIGKSFLYDNLKDAYRNMLDVLIIWLE